MAQTVAAARDQRMEAPARNVFAFAWRQSRRHQPWLCLLAVIIFPLTMRRSAAAADHRPSGRRSESRFAGLAGRHLPGGGAPAGRAEVPPARLRGYGERAHHPRFAPRRPRSGSRRRGGDGSIVASEAERVGLVGEAFSEPILQGGILVAVLGYMLVVEPTIALVSLGFFVPQILLLPMIQQFINRRARRKVKLVRQLGDQIVDQAADRRCAGTTRQVYAVRMSYYRWKFASKLLNNFMNHLAPLGVLMVGGYLVINGGTTIGTVVAFISGFERMADPSRQLLAYYRLAAETQVQYRLIAERQLTA